MAEPDSHAATPVVILTWRRQPRGGNHREEARAFSVRDRTKIAACVMLIALLGADIGLQAALWFGAPTHVGSPAVQQPLEAGVYEQTAPSSGKDYTPLIVGVLTLAVLAYQTLIFHRQANISQMQAGVAQRQIDVVERLERPLLLPILPRFFVGFATSPKYDFPLIEFGLENYGRSPAIVLKTIITCVVSHEAPPVRNEDDQFVLIEAVPRQIVGRSRMHWSNPYVLPGERLGPIDVKVARALTETELRELQDGTCFVWIDGHIIYTDMFGERRETFLLWQYDYHLDHFRLSDVANRNRYM
jgi:hypothetical protein